MKMLSHFLLFSLRSFRCENLACLLGLLAVPVLATTDTFVFSVDQPATGDAKTWTHTVAEAGDYQVGLAWVETLAGDDVALEVFQNSMRVKALYAPTGEVTRFETRLENLAPGDEITVKVIPDGASYRLGYQIAFGTPTFDGLQVFAVSDYGAVGDGVTDDMASIQAAVTAAKQAGGGIVSLDGAKTYRSIGLTDPTVECLFDLDGERDIKVEGNGATILLHPPDSFAKLHDCENVQIDGLKIDYDPIPYYQGTITDIDVANLTIDIDVPERYPEPLVGAIADQDQTRLGPFFGRSFIPDSPGARSGRGDNIHVESTTLNGGPRKVRIQVPATVNGEPMEPRVRAALDNNATEFVVPHLLYGHRNGQTEIHRCSRVKFSNLHYVRMAYFWLNIQHNTGPITLSNVDLKMTAPETELLASWRDGMHIKNGRWGILVEDGDLDGAAMYDDTFALYSRTQEVVGVAGNVVTLTPSFQGRETFLWQPGDWASIWTPDQGILRGMARAVQAVDVADPNYEVTFESIPAGVKPGDIVLHEESLNRGTVIRNCRTSKIGTEDSSTRFRGTDVLFQDNHFEDFALRFEYDTSFASPRSRNVVIEDCWLSADEGQITLTRPSGVLFRGGTIHGTDVVCEQGAKDAFFHSVAFENVPGRILNLTSASTARLFGATSRNGSTAGLSSWVDKDGASTVSYTAPAGYPPAVPPSGGEDTVAPLPPMGLVADARGPQVWLDWTSSPEPDRHSYKVYRGATAGGPYVEVASGLVASKWIHAGVDVDSTYHYVVKALDNSGNESVFSSPVEVQTDAALVVHEDFDYGSSTLISGQNGGTGWSGAWASPGTSLATASSGESLWFGQSPITEADGSTHVGHSNAGSRVNVRNFAPAVDLATQTFYFTMLIRVQSGLSTVDLSAEFFDGAGAIGNRRATVGITGGDLFVDPAATATPGGTASGLYALNTNYLLVMKRDTAGIWASLIEADGNPATLAVEPSTWQVSESGVSGVDLTSMRLTMDTGGVARLDEIRLATEWASVVDGLVPGTTFDQWIADVQWGLAEADQGFNADPDGDKLANGLEAWLGTHPGEFNPGLADLATGGTSTTFTHPQNDNPPSDLTGFYEWSTNLSDWYAGDGVDGPGGGPTVTFSVNTVGTTTTVTATASEVLERLFLRVRVM